MKVKKKKKRKKLEDEEIKIYAPGKKKTLDKTQRWEELGCDKKEKEVKERSIER